MSGGVSIKLTHQSRVISEKTIPTNVLPVKSVLCKKVLMWNFLDTMNVILKLFDICVDTFQNCLRFSKKLYSVSRILVFWWNSMLLSRTMLILSFHLSNGTLITCLLLFDFFTWSLGWCAWKVNDSFSTFRKNASLGLYSLPCMRDVKRTKFKLRCCCWDWKTAS